MGQEQNYRFKCRNPRCKYEALRRMTTNDFDKTQYENINGFSCDSCGFSKMAVIKSNQVIKDGFIPGFQRNIRKICNTYGEYKCWLKKLGLVELGYEDLPAAAYEDININYWSDETLKMVYNTGVEISGREAMALQSGELFK